MAFYGGGKGLWGKLGYTFSDAKFKTRLPAKGLLLDWLADRGSGPQVRMDDLCTWAHLRATPWLASHHVPFCSLGTVTWGKNQEASLETCCQQVGTGWIQSVLWRGLPSRDPDGMATRCPWGSWQFYLKCNLLKAGKWRVGELCWAPLLPSPPSSLWWKPLSQ